MRLPHYVSTLLEILVYASARLWRACTPVEAVSTLLEILEHVWSPEPHCCRVSAVSTLLEILVHMESCTQDMLLSFQPFLRFWLTASKQHRNSAVRHVSTLLEILGKVTS